MTSGQTCTPNAPVSHFQFQPGKVHLLRLINAGAEGLQRLAIDGHRMTVIANDFTPVHPYEVDFVTLGVGQRTDILVKGIDDEPAGAYWMRSNISTICSPAKQPNAVAAIYYPEADTSVPPNSTASTTPPYPDNCTNVCKTILSIDLQTIRLTSDT